MTYPLPEEVSRRIVDTLDKFLSNPSVTPGLVARQEFVERCLPRMDFFDADVYREILLRKGDQKVPDYVLSQPEVARCLRRYGLGNYLAERGVHF